MSPAEEAMIRKAVDSAPPDGKTFGTRASANENGGPAFPRAAFEGQRIAHTGHSGMSLRDYFAAAFVQGLLAADRKVDIRADTAAQCIAAWAYALADAMLAERAKVRP
jgi:hypothetical protein